MGSRKEVNEICVICVELKHVDNGIIQFSLSVAQRNFSILNFRCVIFISDTSFYSESVLTKAVVILVYSLNSSFPVADG
jgi:hypothetical protein